MTKKYLFMFAGALLMFSGDYLTAYYDAVGVFLTGDAMSAGGWLLLMLGFEA